jgi:hypothetical protein
MKSSNQGSEYISAVIRLFDEEYNSNTQERLRQYLRHIRSASESQPRPYVHPQGLLVPRGTYGGNYSEA